MSLDRPPINSGVPHSARIWNYWLGGKDCYQIDRQVGDQIRSLNPEIVDIARAQRAFLKRAVTYLAGEVGIRQFLDVGTGLPTHDNTHEVAQSVAPESRIVYVDHDPVVLQHAHTLLAGTPEGATDYIEADLRDPAAILRAARATLDFERPVALMLLGIAAHIPDDSAYDLVGELKSALPAGSHLVFCDSTEMFHPAEMRAMVERWNEAGDNPRVNRTPDQLARFFTGFDLLPPGLVPVADWHAPSDDPSRRDVDSFGGVALKP